MEHASENDLCPRCRAPLVPGAKFCSQCGTALGPGAPLGRSGGAKWYYNVWFVLLMLFLVLGPFGLPLVWKNPRFSRPMKLALTVVILLYTAWLVQLVLQAFQSAMKQVDELQRSLAF